MTRTDTADAILDAAEHRIRRGGFAAASFRELAADVGVKSASVHYHFPQKADLGSALVNRYADRFMEVLAAPDAPDELREQRLERMIEAYIASLESEGAACLCTILGASTRDLPGPVSLSVDRFFKGLVGWGTTALGDQDDAEFAVSTLQGAMVLAVATDNPQALDRAAQKLRVALRATQT